MTKKTIKFVAKCYLWPEPLISLRAFLNYKGVVYRELEDTQLPQARPDEPFYYVGLAVEMELPAQKVILQEIQKYYTQIQIHIGEQDAPH